MTDEQIEDAVDKVQQQLIAAAAASVVRMREDGVDSAAIDLVRTQNIADIAAYVLQVQALLRRASSGLSIAQAGDAAGMNLTKVSSTPRAAQ